MLPSMHDRLPVGRDRRIGIPATVGEALQIGSVGTDRGKIDRIVSRLADDPLPIGFLIVLAVLPGIMGSIEQDSRTVGRPHGMNILAQVARDLPHIASIRLHDENIGDIVMD